MDSNTSSFVLNSSTFYSVLYQHKEDHGLIDLGLSLRTMQPETYYSSRNCGYEDLMEWPQSNLNMKNSRCVPQNLIDEEKEGVQSNERCANYNVKVNMDGFTIGRKNCVLHHEGYSSIAIQLEDMFGCSNMNQNTHCTTSTNKINGGLWVMYLGKEFVECVKRLRIARKN